MFYLNHVSIVSVYRYFRFWQLPVLVSYTRCHMISLFYRSPHTDPFWGPCLLRYVLEVCLQTISRSGEDKWIGAVWGQHCGSPSYCAFSVQASAFTGGSSWGQKSFSFWLWEPVAQLSRVWNGVVGSWLHAATFWGINNAVGTREMLLSCALVDCLHLLHLGISSFSWFWHPHAFSLPFSGILVIMCLFTSPCCRCCS